MSKPIKNTPFKDAVVKQHGTNPSSGDCHYVDSDLSSPALVLGHKMGTQGVLLDELGKK